MSGATGISGTLGDCTPAELRIDYVRASDAGQFVAVGERRVVVFRRGHFQVLFEVRDFSREPLRKFEFLLDIGAFTERGLRLGLFVPEARFEGLVGQFREKTVEFRDVKDAPLAPQSAFEGRRSDRGSRRA